METRFSCEASYLAWKLYSVNPRENFNLLDFYLHLEHDRELDKYFEEEEKQSAQNNDLGMEA